MSSDTVVAALITGFRDGAIECGRMSDDLEALARELVQVDEFAAAMASSHSLDASHIEQRLHTLIEQLQAARGEGEG